ncbi:hypothetical protein [Streptomyces sp. NPDC060205]|uniref:hypothetical protein n=1 Tax=Streptomyces sp. NPDC060205 TaxID=3347072 RepID=UPI00364A91D7
MRHASAADTWAVQHRSWTVVTDTLNALATSGHDAQPAHALIDPCDDAAMQPLTDQPLTDQPRADRHSMGVRRRGHRLGARVETVVPGARGAVSIHPSFGEFGQDPFDFGPDVTNNAAVLAVN